MGRNTLQYKICRKCKKKFAIGRYISNTSNYCLDCEASGWMEEMKRLGCNIDNPSKLGDTPYSINKKAKECPLEMVDGRKYRDATTLLFYDTKYKKVYPTDEEWERINKYEARKIKVKKEEKERRKALKKDEIKERDKVIENARKEGLTYEQIATKFDINIATVDATIVKLIKQNKIKSRGHKRYTPEMIEQMIKMRDKGIPYQEIADLIGKSENGVRIKFSELIKKGVIN